MTAVSSYLYPTQKLNFLMLNFYIYFLYIYIYNLYMYFKVFIRTGMELVIEIFESHKVAKWQLR